MATRFIELVLHGNAGQAIGEMEHLATVTGASADSMHAKISNMAAKVTMATAAAGIGIAAVSVKLADDFEKAHAQLLSSLKDTGQHYQDLKWEIDGATEKGQKFGYNQTEIEGLLAKGNTALGNNSKALKALQMAEDMSARTGKDLNTTYLLATKALEGQLGPLKRAGIDLPIVAGGAKALATAQGQLAKAQESAQAIQEKVNDGRLKGQAATDALRGSFEKLSAANQKVNDVQDAGTNIADAWNKKFGGAAAASAETFTGKVKALQAQLENIGIKIGQAIIPIVEQLASALGDVIGWFEKNKTAAEALGIAIGTVLAAAISIFVFDKVVAMIAGLQRIGVGLGLLAGESEAAAATVSASGTQMAFAFETTGAAAGAEGAAGGMGLLASSAAPVVLGLALVAGTAYGLSQTFGDSDGWAVKLHFDLGNMAAQSVPQLSQKFSDLSGNALVMNKVLDDNKASTLAAKTMHEDFNKILDQSPQFAAKFIAGVLGAGQSTEWYSKKLQEHVVAAEEAKVAQERFALQMEIVDAKARGDAGAVYGLTLQLNALPSDKQIRISADTNAAGESIRALQQQLDNLPDTRTIGIRIVGDTGNPNFTLAPNG